MSTLMRTNGLFPSGSFFDDFFTRDLFDWPRRTEDHTAVPRVNIVETSDDFRVEMAAPGMKKEDFKLKLDNDMLVIQTELASEDAPSENDDTRYVRREFNYFTFKRSFHLPNTVDTDSIEAKYQDGILHLVIPKKEEARKKPVKTIAVG